ncbi:MAG: hypothetical protein SAL70_17495 [Scytonema sp. PMC 1070.18]|nr:hypothetical protein [Scytonema sp. PMC 1070.18]
MNFISQSKVLFNAGLSLLGLVGATTLATAPASAQTASASGSVVIVRPSGSSMSVSGEVTLPSGYYFKDVNVKPELATDTAGTNAEVITNLTVGQSATATDPGEITAPLSSNPVLNAIAETIKSPGGTDITVEDQAAIIRSLGGISGLE